MSDSCTLCKKDTITKKDVAVVVALPRRGCVLIRYHYLCFKQMSGIVFESFLELPEVEGGEGKAYVEEVFWENFVGS